MPELSRVPALPMVFGLLEAPNCSAFGDGSWRWSGVCGSRRDQHEGAAGPIGLLEQIAVDRDHRADNHGAGTALNEKAPDPVERRMTFTCQLNTPRSIRSEPRRVYRRPHFLRAIVFFGARAEPVVLRVKAGADAPPPCGRRWP
jgi:hypothetical protein